MRHRFTGFYRFVGRFMRNKAINGIIDYTIYAEGEILQLKREIEREKESELGLWNRDQWAFRLFCFS